MDGFKKFISRIWPWVCIISFIVIAGSTLAISDMIIEGEIDLKELLADNIPIIAEIKNETYNKGFLDGRSEGYSESEKDSSKSYNAGYEDGYDEGYADGLNARKKAESEKSEIPESSESSDLSSFGGGGRGGFTDYGEAEEICDYVLNKNTGKFHRPGCSSVSNIKPNNREYFTGTRGEAIARGYDPCGRCNP